MFEPIIGLIGAALYLLGFATCAILCVGKQADKPISCAIVEQAVKDYRAAKRKYRNSAEIASLRRFFRSDWFRTLTNVDGEYLIRMLDEEAKRGDKLVHEGDTA